MRGSDKYGHMIGMYGMWGGLPVTLASRASALSLFLMCHLLFIVLKSGHD